MMEWYFLTVSINRSSCAPTMLLYLEHLNRSDTSRMITSSCVCGVAINSLRSLSNHWRNLLILFGHFFGVHGFWCPVISVHLCLCCYHLISQLVMGLPITQRLLLQRHHYHQNYHYYYFNINNSNNDNLCNCRRYPFHRCPPPLNGSTHTPLYRLPGQPSAGELRSGALRTTFSVGPTRSYRPFAIGHRLH